MISNEYMRRAKKYLILSLGCFLVMGLLMGGQCRKVQEALAKRIAPAVLRFHVLAESDGRRDQEVKLQVRSRILDYIREQLSPGADRGDTMEFVEKHAGEIEAAADQYLREQGMNYKARVEITNCYFPARAYGPYTFPCGYYDAVRVTLGSGRGHNWWCVIYPQFCFLDADWKAGAAGPETPAGSDPLQNLLERDDYLALKDDRPQIQIQLRLTDLFHWEKLTQSPSVPSPPTHRSQ